MCRSIGVLATIHQIPAGTNICRMNVSFLLAYLAKKIGKITNKFTNKQFLSFSFFFFFFYVYSIQSFNAFETFLPKFAAFCHFAKSKKNTHLQQTHNTLV